MRMQPWFPLGPWFQKGVFDARFALRIFHRMGTHCNFLADHQNESGETTTVLS